jgi:Tfp pilus assembly protein PilP
MKYKYDNKYQKEIEQMIVKEDTVEYLDHLYERFDLDALRNLAIKTQEYNEQLLRKEGIKIGMKEGRYRGKNEGRIEMCIDLINDGTLTIEQAAKKLNISVEKMKKLMKN